MTRNPPQRNILFLPFAYQPKFHIGVALYAGKHGWHLNADMARTGKIPYGWHGDGIVTVLTEDDTAERLVMQFGVPTVDLSVIRPDLPIAHVAKDNTLIGQIGARHFLDQGWHRFVFFSRTSNNVCRMRIDGYRQEIERHGFPCEALIRPILNQGNDDRWDHVCDWLVAELGRLPKPVAVMAYNDYDAAVVMDACLAAGLKVPGDVGVLGVDNTAEVCPCLPVALSSVKSRETTVGYKAAELLDQLIDGAPIPKRPILVPPAGIAHRESTNRLVIRNERLRRAVAVIEETLQRPCSMEQIADAADLSRKGLYNLFNRELHRTPTEFLLGKRLKLARELLADSHESIGSIARRCGIPVLSTFIRHFRHDTGLTPGQWRRLREHGAQDQEENPAVWQS